MAMKLKVTGAEFNYDENPFAGFSDINFSLEAGESMCILGPNGCGKTTLLKSIIRIVKLKKGRVEIVSPHLQQPGFH